MLEDEDLNEMLGGVPGVRIAGLSDEAIDTLTVCYTFQKCPTSQSKLEDVHPEPQSKCTICMEEFATGDLLRCLPCLHSYHVQCIDKWLSLSQSCPVCKHNVMATTTPCFESPGQMTCPPLRTVPLPHAWHFNRPRPSFQVVPRLPLLRGGPLPPSQAARHPRPSLGVVPGVPASSTAVPVYRGAAVMPRLAPVLARAPVARAVGIATTGQAPAPRIQPQSEESESESSSSGTSSGNSTP